MLLRESQRSAFRRFQPLARVVSNKGIRKEKILRRSYYIIIIRNQAIMPMPVLPRRLKEIRQKKSLTDTDQDRR